MDLEFLNVAITILFCMCPYQIFSLHVNGKWKNGDFFLFLSKFGFQKTDLLQRSNTQGYIYGNITSSSNVSTGSVLVVTDSEYFLDFYSHRKVVPRTKACPLMFNKIDTIAWDNDCNRNGKEDFLRKVPCPNGELCSEEDKPDIVVPKYQFTYHIRDTKQPRFWFISMVSCYRNSSNTSSCYWSQNPSEDIEIEYDIYFVNGDPDVKHYNPFEHQFSFEMHDVVEIYFIFCALYTFLLPLQLYALSKQKHTIPRLLTSCIIMECIGILLNTVHILKFAFDGEGVIPVQITGNFIDSAAQCLFMLLLLLLAKGWTITTVKLSFKPVLYGVWGSYTVVNLFLFVWNLTEVDTVSDKDEWQTWPGYLILAFRTGIMIWFVYELQKSFSLESNYTKRRFYLHFGAGFLVWFIYLPIVALISAEVSALWRYKTILSMTCAADFLSYAVLLHLLWPSRSALYFNLSEAWVVKMTDLEMTSLLSDDSDIEHMNTVDQTKNIPNGNAQHLNQDKIDNVINGQILNGSDQESDQ